MRVQLIGAGSAALSALFCVCALGTLADQHSPAAAAANKGTELRSGSVPVLVELFTSEGCSSCPPADAALLSLASEQEFLGAEVIALEEHVDYWNRLGWTDPFSSRAFSLRQDEYEEAFGRIYTPHMIVDGRTAFVGSDLSRARNAVAQAARSRKASVRITGTPDKLSGDVLTIRIESAPFDGDASTPELWVGITEDGLSTDVRGGENGGRKLRHGAVVRALERIGRFDPGSAADAQFRIGPDWVRERLRVVAFVQERASHRILGATVAPFSAL
jgi:hypothetical protein